MELEIMRNLRHLAQPDPAERRAAMEEILRDAHLPYTEQVGRPDTKKLQEAHNFLVKLGEQETPCLLFCAHYDSYAGSIGANDNAAAVCVLVALAKTLQAQGVCAEFAFFDAEETARVGSRLYVREMDKKTVTGVINVDLCGYGDTLVISGNARAKKPALASFGSKDILQKYGARQVKYLPESDDTSFRNTQLPVLSISTVPRWDIQFLNTLATYGSGALGRPPEFDMILDQMEVTTTMHGGFRDTVKDVQPEAIERTYNYLLEAATTPAVKKGFFSRK